MLLENYVMTEKFQEQDKHRLMSAINLRGQAHNFFVWLLVFSSLMLWLWQLRYGGILVAPLQRQWAMLVYGLALVSLPLLLLRWVGVSLLPHTFVMLAGLGLLLVHLALPGNPSLVELLHGYFGMPSLATLVLVSLATIRLLGNKPSIISTPQLKWFAAGIVVCMLLQQLLEAVFSGVKSYGAFVWVDDVLAVGCVFLAFLSQWRRMSLSAVWLACALIGWSLDGLSQRQADLASLSSHFYASPRHLVNLTSGARPIACAPHLSNSCALAAPASASFRVFHYQAQRPRDLVVANAARGVGPHVEGDPAMRGYASYYPSSAQSRQAQVQRRATKYGLGDWLADWFALVCAVLWLVRVGSGSRRRRDH